MGRSAKNMKRPTAAEKLSRTVNAPPPSLLSRRSLSPDIAIDGPKLAIPLFNTSAKRRGSQLARETQGGSGESGAGEKDDSAAARMEDGDDSMMEDGEAGRGVQGKSNRAKIGKEKLRAAREGMKDLQEKGKNKLAGKREHGRSSIGAEKTKTKGTAVGKVTGKGKAGVGVLGGSDYLKVFEPAKRRFR